MISEIDKQYSEYRIKCDFSVGLCIDDPEKAERFIKEEINVMLSKLERYRVESQTITNDIFLHRLEVEPT